MKRDYANELDLLRFLAALAVTMFHLVPRCVHAYGVAPLSFEPLAAIAKYGYMGVDLFFMISGFVVIASAQSGSLRQFVTGRITRLYPAFWFCCTLAFFAILALGNHQQLSWTAYLANMTMYPRAFGFNYVDGTYWTLALELRFYFLLGCLILIGQIRNVERWMIGWLIASILMIAFKVMPLRYVLLIDYSSYFIAGALFQFIRTSGVTAGRLAALGLCLLVSLNQALLTLIQQPLYADRSRIVVCLLTLAFYAVFLAISLRRTGWFAALRWTTLGQLTYPLYLLHQTAGLVLITYLRPPLPSAATFTLTIAASLLAAWLVHRYVEGVFAPRFRTLLAASGKPASRSVAAD